MVSLDDALIRFFNPQAMAQPAPDDDFWYTPLIGSSNSIAPTEFAMRVSAVNACVGRYANSVAMTPWITYRSRGDKGGKDRAKNADAYRLLHDKPNGWHTPFQFKQLQTGLAILGGNAYARIVPDVEHGALGSLHPYNPNMVEPERLPSGQRRYKVRHPDGREETLLQDEMFHLTGLHYDGVRGIGAIEFARDSIIEAAAAAQYSRKLLVGGVRPGGVLTHPGTLSAPARSNLKASLNAFAGAANAGQPLLIEDGMTWQTIGMSNEAAQYIQSRQMTVVEIARAFNMPLIMIQEQSTTSSWGTGVEQQMIGFIMFTMMPVFTNFEQRANADLLLADPRLSTEFLAANMMRGDTKSRYDVYKVAIDMGILNPNEARDMENMNPYDGGDEYQTAPRGAPAPPQQAGEPPPPPPPAPSGPKNPRMEILSLELATRLARADSAEVTKAATRYATDGAGWEAWLNTHYTKVEADLVSRYSVDPGAARDYATEQRDSTIWRGAAHAEEAQAAKVSTLQLMLGGS